MIEQEMLLLTRRVIALENASRENSAVEKNGLKELEREVTLNANQIGRNTTEIDRIKLILKHQGKKKSLWEKIKSYTD